MSSAAAQAIYLKRADYSIQAASVAILYYDYFLTFGDEVTLIWWRTRKITALLYASCRYALLANLMWLLYKTPDFTGLSCDAVSRTSGILSIFGHFGVLSVWGLRTCAVYGGSKAVSIPLAILGLTVMGLRITNEVWNRCGGNAGASLELGISVAAVMLAFEGIAFALAAVRVWKTVRHDRKFWDNPRASINYVVFAQGFLYISAVFGLSIMTAIFNLKVWGGWGTPLNSLKLPLSGLMTARFLLKIRHWQHRAHFKSTNADSDIISTVLNFESRAALSEHGESAHSTTSRSRHGGGRMFVETYDDTSNFDSTTLGMSWGDTTSRPSRRGSIMHEFASDIGPLPPLSRRVSVLPDMNGMNS